MQFCGNDANTVLAAAAHVEDQVDAVDLNFGCPQRIARRGKYGAFLMDDLGLVSPKPLPADSSFRTYPG